MIYLEGSSIPFSYFSGMLHDEDVFPDPEEFMPERFMKDGKIRTDLPDPEVVATFGFGRRCVSDNVILTSLNRRSLSEYVQDPT
jgi:cytochrome P450